MLFAAINVATSGNNSIVAADASGRRIYVLGYCITFGGSVNAEWMDGTTAITGLLHGLNGANIVAPLAPPIMGSRQYWLATSAGNALQLNLSASTNVGGHVVYEFGT